MFTRRQFKILEILLNNVQGVTGAKLSEYLEVSSRTIRNEIGEINRIWEEGTIIRASKRKGYFIEEQYVEPVREYFRRENRKETDSEAMDRGFTILGMVLESGRADVFEIGEQLFLSQPAVYKEITKLQKLLLSEYKSELLRMRADKLWVEGDEKKIRHMLFRLIKNETQKGTHLYYRFLKMLLYRSFAEEEYGQLVRLIKDYFDSRNIQILDANLYMIVSAVYITLVRNGQNHKVTAIEKTEQPDQELWEFFDYLEEQKVFLGEGDIQILGGLFSGFKLTADPAAESGINDLNVLILEEFCHEVMEKYHFDLWQSQSFYNDILVHIEYMMRRMDTGYPVKNPILNDIKKQYPYAYEISMLMVPIVYRYKSCYIQDDEISYIAVFVEHFLENVNQKLKAVIISSARFSVTTIIRNWLQMNFQNQIEIAAMLPAHNLEKYIEENPVDLIISTDTMVHPAITTFKIQGLPDHYTMEAMNALIHKIRMNYRFREIIKEHFNEKTIRIYSNKVEFEEIILQLSQALKEEDCIYDVEEYVKDVLQREENYPTFMGDWFMIPHPLLTFAKKTAIAVAILKKPIRMKEKEIQLVFLLAMEKKQNEQIGVLFQLFRYMALKRSWIGMLAAAETKEEFIKGLIQISNSAEIC